MKKHLRIHRKGYPFILIAFFLTVTLVVLFFLFYKPNLLWFSVLLLFWPILVGSLFFVINFFRIPKRDIRRDENAIIAPADGEIIFEPVKVLVEEHFKTERIRISIFMSPLNVHVNTYPIDGEVVYTKYHPGKHFTAYSHNATDENEHSTVVQKHKNGEEIMFRQISGIIARRVWFSTKKGDFGKQGEEMGIIKFGSRVDVFLPLSAEVLVEKGDIVLSKLTRLARFS